MRQGRGSRRFDKLTAFLLTAVMVLSMNGFSVLAETSAASGAEVCPQTEEVKETRSRAVGTQTSLTQTESGQAQTESQKVQTQTENQETQRQSSLVQTESQQAQTESSQAQTEEETSQALPLGKKAALRKVSYQGVQAIYLDGQKGDDGKDGLTAQSAVKTFAKAKEIAEGNPDIKTIYVTGTVPVSGIVSLDKKKTDAVVKRDSSFTGALMKVSGEAHFKDITIDGNGANVKAKAPLLSVTGTVNIEDGTALQNNSNTGDLGYFRSLGGALYIDGGRVTMTGGRISGSAANMGGGVFVSGGAQFVMDGGSIEANEAVAGTGKAYDGYAAGGGVAIYNGSSMIFNSGSVSNNTSRDIGGGISVGTNKAGNRNAHDTFTMTGGTVSGNTSGSCGGGIMIQEGPKGKNAIATISGGNITGNKMTNKGRENKRFGGGGIYVNGSNQSGHESGKLTLYNALITNNTAAQEGGGFAGCPSSNTKIYLNQGAAIIGNKGSKANDIYLLASRAYGTHSGNPSYYISPFMLGGTPYLWKYEDGAGAPLNELQGKVNGSNRGFLLHTDVTEDAAAKSAAKVIISGNTCETRGGGIGSNGIVVMGDGSPKLTKLTVDKAWKLQKGMDIPTYVGVYVYRKTAGSDEKPLFVGYQKLNANKKWTAAIENLPESDAEGRKYEYFVK